MNEVLGIGITGHALTDLERRLIKETPPYGVVLFGRNVGDAEQLRALIAEIKSLTPRPPLFMIDEEGGRVDRLRSLLPGLPSVEAFGEGEAPLEMARWAGRVIGMALRYFDIEVNLAPVVDVRGEMSPKGLERRTFGSDVESVVRLAGAFIDAHHEQGAATCLKHFPGIGTGSADPHYGATVIDLSFEEMTRRDLAPFTQLGNRAAAIMIGHGTYPQIDESNQPASLSRRVTTELLRETAGFTGVAMSDDMEMHAVSDLGSYEYTAESALLAGNDVVMYCSHIERMPELARYLHKRIAEDASLNARFEEAHMRAESYRAHCTRLRSNSSPAQSFDAVRDEAARFVEAFNKSRPTAEIAAESKPRTGDRTGREEWT